MKKITFTIKGELPDLNSYIQAERGNRFKAAKIKKEATDTVHWEAKAASLTPVLPEEYPVIVHVNWFSKDERKDVDNVRFAMKFVLDGLVSAGVIENDSRKFVEDVSDSFQVDRKNPRCEVTIYPS